MVTPLSESFAPAYCGHGGSSGSNSRVIIFDLLVWARGPGLPRIQCSVNGQVTGTVRTGTRAGSLDLAMGLSLCSEMFHLSGRDK
jgi:hypothetical protein